MNTESSENNHLLRAQCDQIWRISTTLAKFKSFWEFSEGLIYLSFVKSLDPIMARTAIRQIFIVVNGQILKNIIAVWSHCSYGKYQCKANLFSTQQQEQKNIFKSILNYTKKLTSPQKAVTETINKMVLNQ